MRRIKLERVTGVVALAYLVIIPVVGYIVWERVRQIDEDVSRIFKHLPMESSAK